MSALDGHDRVAVRGIAARGFHGVFDAERREGQTFVVDVVLGVDTRQAAATDDLADTTDYGAVAVAVVALVEGEPVDLIETLAEQIAAACLGFDGVRAVEVTVHKPEAPVGVTFSDVAVTIVRPR
jgi:dihydroneopterin aldolase